jgi:hypothetical protein
VNCLNIKIKTANIVCDEVVKLLGIDIDYQLNLDKHIQNICRKASHVRNICNITKLNKKFTLQILVYNYEGQT